MKYDLKEEHIFQFPASHKLYNIFTITIYSFFLNIIIVLYMTNVLKLSLTHIYFYLIIPSTSIILFIVRNKLIKKMFYFCNQLIIYNINGLSPIMMVFIILFILPFIFLNTRVKYFPDYVDLLYSVILLSSLILYYIFFPLLTEEGELVIELNYLNKYYNNFIKRSYWLMKICSKIENMFKINKICVSRDELCYEINISSLKGNNVGFTDIADWLLMDEKDYTILQRLKNVIPDIKTPQYKRVPWYEQVQQTIKYLIPIGGIIQILELNPQILPKIWSLILTLLGSPSSPV